VGVARQLRRNEDAVAKHSDSMACHLGDVEEYYGLVNDLTRLEKDAARGGAARRRNQTHDDLARLRKGDVVAVPGGRRAGLAVVLDPGVSSDGSARPLVITEKRWAGRLSNADFRGPVPALGHVRLPKHIDHGSAEVRRQVAATLLAQGIATPRGGPRRDSSEDAEIGALRVGIRTHPVHGCADRDAHLQWARRREALLAENRALTVKVSSAKDSLGNALDRIVGLLRALGYLKESRLTDAGRQLSRIWSESDLVVAECLRCDAWSGLGPADLAATVSALVFEARQDVSTPPRMPSAAAAEAIADTVRIWSRIAGLEREANLPVTREPDLGFASAVAAWADGSTLTQALAIASASGSELSAGDFVRWCRQVIDLLDQLQGVDAGTVGQVAGEAVRGLRRGVVALGAS
jgi:ATP-dependent RNA helicase HelY